MRTVRGRRQAARVSRHSKSVAGVVLSGLALWLAACGARPAPAAPAEPPTARFERFEYIGRAQEALAPTRGQFRNPILPGYHPDPSVLRVGEDYYLIHSSFAHFPGIPVYHSRNLVDWTQIGNAIDRPTQLPLRDIQASEGVFAADLSYHDGRYYIVSTCVQCGGNFLITADRPDGPWSDPVWFDFDGIDPSLYWEGERAYLLNNGPPDEAPRYEGHRAIWIQAFDAATQSLVGERHQIVNGGVDLRQQPIWIEGPHLFRHDGHYYLIAAEGGTAEQHSEVVFRADAVFGPYRPGPRNPILTQRDLDPARQHPVTSAGHAKFVVTPAGEWWATFLATRPYDGSRYNIGRETFLLPVRWRNGWPQILPPGVAIPLLHERPGGLPALTAPPAPAGDVHLVETFGGETLPPAWLGLRAPAAPVYRLRGGGLEILPQSPWGQVAAAPGFVGLRQRHHDTSVSVDLRFQPVKEGDRAGLAAIQNDQAYCLYGLTRIAGRTHLALFVKTAGAPERRVASVPFDEPVIRLSVHLRGGTATLSYSGSGGPQVFVSDLDNRFLSTAEAGGFVGTLIGPYADY